MNLTAKLQPAIILAASLIGLLLGYFIKPAAESPVLVELFLMILLYFVFLSADLRKIRDSFLNLKFTCSSLLINFVWTPIFGVVLGYLFFSGSVDLRIGLLMLLVTPCTDWYLVFTGLAGGNVPLGTALLPLNLILQILLLPVYLFLFMNGKIQVDSISIIISIIFVLLIPFTLALLTKLIVKKTVGLKAFEERFLIHGDNLQLIFLCLAIVAMFASESKSLFQQPMLLVKMFIPLIIFFMVNFFIAQLVGRKQRFSYEDTAALTFTTLARNSPLSLAIAVAAFPDRPLISLALVIGPLIELPVLAIVANILRKQHKKH